MSIKYKKGPCYIFTQHCEPIEVQGGKWQIQKPSEMKMHPISARSMVSCLWLEATTGLSGGFQSIICCFSSLVCLGFVIEICHLLAIEPRSSKAAYSHRTAQEWTAAPTADGGVWAARGAAPHPGQRGWEGLSHHDGPDLLPAHPPCHWLHLWQRHTEGGLKQGFDRELYLAHRRIKSVSNFSWISLRPPT